MNLKQLGTIVVKRVFFAAGLRVERAKTPAFGWDAFFHRLKARGFHPKTVIDVGVAWGTPDLYSAFPDAHFILVEPLREFENAIQALCKKLNATVVRAAAGASPGKLTMYIEKTPSASSMFPENVDEKVNSYEVDVVRLDSVIGPMQRPVLLKLDVQGMELDVIRGCEGILDNIDMIILEATLLARTKDYLELASVVSEMLKRGFVVYDIISATYRPFDQATAQVDMVFVPVEHALRSNRTWH